MRVGLEVVNFDNLDRRTAPARADGGVAARDDGTVLDIHLDRGRILPRRSSVRPLARREREVAYGT